MKIDELKEISTYKVLIAINVKDWQIFDTYGFYDINVLCKGDILSLKTDDFIYNEGKIVGSKQLIPRWIRHELIKEELM